ncbi:GCR1-dependent translation factor 1 [Pseudogymnoascus australis]
MKLRLCRASPLLILLVPSLAAAAALAADASDTPTPTNIAVARDVPPSATDLGAQLAGQKPTSLGLHGTKDAPVDGKDGKPHAGPFVDSDRKKPEATGTSDELIDSKKQTPLKGAPEDITMVDGQKIPDVNDGVMNDPERQLPKDGTTGTEGGVSQKDKDRKAQEGQTGERLEKKPDPPKEAPPLPHSEQELIKTGTEKVDKDIKKPKAKDSDPDEDYELAGLEKPDELPKKPVDLPHPIPDSAHKDHLDFTKPAKTGQSKADAEGVEGLIQPLHSFILSLTMILVSEIGDKTFLIAALMAMKHDRILVFTAAFSALITMTVLSAVLGHAVPSLLPQRFTNFMAAILFLIFGVKMLREGQAMSPTEGVAAEMQEVEMELEEKELELRQQGGRRSSASPYALEMGLGHSSRKSRSKTRLPSPPRSPSSSRGSSPVPGSALKNAAAGFSNLVSLLLSPAWVQTFVMTFLGEWGDRSQIATIAMAAGQDYWWVTAGAICGHAVCTGVAVIGGRAIAGRVSLRVVTLGGAFAFIIFGIVYLLHSLHST